MGMIVMSLAKEDQTAKAKKMTSLKNNLNLYMNRY